MITGILNLKESVESLLKVPELVSYELPVVLGRSGSGELISFDLVRTPNLLIAGAVGQGKTTAIKRIIDFLSRSKTPEEVKFILIDPKMVELGDYSKMHEVYTQYDEIKESLRSVCKIIEQRQDDQKCQVKNNQKIIVVIDEYACTIADDNNEVPLLVNKITQDGKAVGIFVIITTQRPHPQILTTEILANFPARLAFRTTTAEDSITILGYEGAEKLRNVGEFIIRTIKD